MLFFNRNWHWNPRESPALSLCETSILDCLPRLLTDNFMCSEPSQDGPTVLVSARVWKWWSWSEVKWYIYKKKKTSGREEKESLENRRGRWGSEETARRGHARAKRWWWGGDYKAKWGEIKWRRSWQRWHFTEGRASLNTSTFVLGEKKEKKTKNKNPVTSEKLASFEDRRFSLVSAAAINSRANRFTFSFISCGFALLCRF